MQDCIFCKIVKGEIPSEKIFEDDNYLAFLDIHPVTKGHALLVPKKHVDWMQKADDKTIAEIYIRAKNLMQKMISDMPVDYVELGVIGKDVPHFHIHLKPRMF